MFTLDEIKAAASKVQYPIDWDLPTARLENAMFALNQIKLSLDTIVPLYERLITGQSSLPYDEQEEYGEKMGHVIFELFVLENVANTVLAVTSITE